MPEIYHKNFPNPPKAIIFDWDGVLVQTTDFIKEAFFFTHQKILPHLEKPKDLPALSLRNYFPQLFKEESKRAEKIFYHYVEKNHLRALKEMEGAGVLLDFLAQKGIPLFIISNKKGELLRKEVDYLFWTGYFKRIIGAGDCAEDKPSVLPVSVALGTLGFQASKDIWFIGDSDVDVECAVKSGCTSLFMQPQGKIDALAPLKYPTDVRVFSCEDLQSIVINNIV